VFLRSKSLYFSPHVKYSLVFSFLLSKFHSVSCKGHFSPEKGTHHYLQTLVFNSIYRLSFMTLAGGNNQGQSHQSQIGSPKKKSTNTILFSLFFFSDQTTKKFQKNMNNMTKLKNSNNIKLS